MTTSGNSTPWVKAILIMFYSCLVTQARMEGMIKQCSIFIHKHRQEILGWFSSSCLFSLLHKLKSSYLSFGFILRARYRRNFEHRSHQIVRSLRSYYGCCSKNIKLELCVSLSVLGLFHVCHVIRNSRSTLLLAWHEWISCKSKNERFTAAGLYIVRTLNMKMVHYIKHCTKKRAARAARSFFLIQPIK